MSFEKFLFFKLQFSDFLVQMERLFHLLVEKDHPGTQTAPFPPGLATIDLENFQKRLQDLGIEISYDSTMNWFTLLDRSGDG